MDREELAEIEKVIEAEKKPDAHDSGFNDAELQGMENESEKVFSKSFTIFPKHLKFLKTVNKNESLALRTVLDSIMNDKDRTRKRELLDTRLIFISFGFIMFFMSYLADSFYVRGGAILVGVAILGYGLIGGVLDAISLRKKEKSS